MIKCLEWHMSNELDHANLYPISDVHLGCKDCRVKEFKDYIEMIRNDNRAVVLLLGDLINNGIKSSVGNVYEEVMRPYEQKRQMAEMLKPIKDKIAILVLGNHEYRSSKETDTDVMNDIAVELGIEERYVGEIGIVKITLGNKKKQTVKRISYHVLCVHGAGGGMYIGSGLNRSENYQYAFGNIDILAQGHTHKPVKLPVPKIDYDAHNNSTTEKNGLVFVCTSWLGYGGYAPAKMLRPVAFKKDYIRLDGKVKEFR